MENYIIIHNYINMKVRIFKMGKKKNKKKLKNIDKNLNIKYDELIREIDGMQKYLNKVDKKARKKAKKKANGDKDLYKRLYKNDISRAKARCKMVKENETFFDNLDSTIKEVEPTAKIVSRIIAALIVSILSIEVVKVNISPEQLDVLDKIYNISMKV